jgi:hypothetical protein
MVKSTYDSLKPGDVLTVDFGKLGIKTLVVKRLLEPRAIHTDKGVFSAKNLVPAIRSVQRPA